MVGRLASRMLEQQLPNINDQLYCDILQMELKHSLRRFPSNLARGSRAMDIVKDKRAQLKLTVLDWIPKSPIV